MLPLMQAIWGDIWKCTMVKSQTNATSVIMHPPMQAFWRDIWIHTVAKSQTSAANVTLHPLRQAVWRYIWRPTVEKNQTNVTSVDLHALIQVLWGDIWKDTMGKNRPSLAFHGTYYTLLSILSIFHFFDWRRGARYIIAWCRESSWSFWEKNMIIIMMFWTCTKSHRCLRCWWRWPRWVGQNTKPLFYFVGIYSAHHERCSEDIMKIWKQWDEEYL